MQVRSHEPWVGGERVGKYRDKLMQVRRSHEPWVGDCKKDTT